ncbi:MAG TPA: BTAD domain-containing putative transcriptional regulator [Streptosporangiaceae bacterium]|nr:BTAD domain-containing putative transcriptional regulator [Streptosporangiaceae bacterium]
MPDAACQLLRVQLLGPVQAWRDGQELDLGHPRQRAVLAVLAMASGRVVSRDELIDAVWDKPPARADTTLYSYVSRLRKALEPGTGGRARAELLATAGVGYVLQAAVTQVDATVFVAGLDTGRRARAADDPAGAASALAGALELWHGTALAGMDGQWAEAQRVRLGEARMVAVEEWAAVRLELGHHADTATELAALVESHPLREELRRLLMLALYGSGRQAEALALFHDTRQVLARQLGIEPSPGLRRVHQQILTADPALGLPPRGVGLGAEAKAAPPRAAPPKAAEPKTAAPKVMAPRQLPADVSVFTGRQAELAHLDRLRGPVVSVVTGSAGVGKTALVVHWAHQAAKWFPDGQLYVNLRGYHPSSPVSATEALARFLHALGVADAEIPLGEAERAALWRSVMADRRLLVVLDNAANVAQVRPLLPGAGPAMVLVTSRDSLSGLIAVDGAHRLPLGLLTGPEAVTLLRSLIGQRVDADTPAAERLASQCARLPLALRVAAELAASRPDEPLHVLTSELAAQPGTAELLDPGGDPHSAVATVFSWSYQHLDPDAAQMFRLVGLHPATHFGAYAAAALTAGLASSAQSAASTASAARVRRLLATLARAHLLAPGTRGRYSMHDLLRSYAAGLAAAHEGEQACRAALTGLFDYYLAACAAAMDALVPAERHRRPDPPPTPVPLPDVATPASARAWLDAELPTLTAVAGHAADQGWPTHAIRLAATIAGGYLDLGHFTEGIVILGHALAAAQSVGDRAAQVRALVSLGHIHSEQAHPGQAIASLKAAVEIARDMDDRMLQGRALGTLASAYSLQGHYQQARDCYEQALVAFRELGEAVGEATNLANLGLLDIRQGRYADATGIYEQALALFRRIGHRLGECNALCNLGEAYYRRGDYELATTHQREALAASREIGWQMGEAYALNGLGDIFHRQGRYGQAMASQAEAAVLFAEVGDREGEACALNSTGETLLATGELEQARACHVQAESLATRSGDQRERARALTRLAEVCLALGQHEAAEGHRDQGLALYREIGDLGGETDALNSAGQALLTAGQPSQAGACHRSALDLACQTGDRYQQARAYHGLAGVSHVTGQKGQAHHHRQQALDLFRDLGVPEAFQAHSSLGDPGERPATRQSVNPA